VHNTGLFYNLSLLLSLVLNLLIITSWSANGDESDPIPVVQDWYFPVLYAIGGMHILVSIFVVIGHFLSNPPKKFGRVCLSTFLNPSPQLNQRINKQTNKQIIYSER